MSQRPGKRRAAGLPGRRTLVVCEHGHGRASVAEIVDRRKRVTPLGVLDARMPPGVADYQIEVHSHGSTRVPFRADQPIDRGWVEATIQWPDGRRTYEFQCPVCKRRAEASRGTGPNVRVRDDRLPALLDALYRVWDVEQDSVAGRHTVALPLLDRMQKQLSSKH